MTKSNVKKAVGYAFSEKPAEFKAAIDAAMKDKVDVAVQAKRIEINSRLLNTEVNEPRAKGEKDFKDLHKVDKKDHPVADEAQFKGKGAKKKRNSDKENKDN